MNYLTRLLLGLGLAIPMSVWAGDAGKFLNLYYKNNALYLGQYNLQFHKNYILDQKFL